MFTVEKVRKYRESFLEPQSSSTGSLCFPKVFHHFERNENFVARLNMGSRSIILFRYVCPSKGTHF